MVRHKNSFLWVFELLSSCKQSVLLGSAAIVPTTTRLAGFAP